MEENTYVYKRFILDFLEISFDLPYSIDANIILRKADKNEIVLVRKYLTNFPGVKEDLIIYERKIKDSEEGIELIKEDKNKWKYWIIEEKFNYLNNKSNDLLFKAFKLQREDIHLCYNLFYNQDKPQFASHTARDVPTIMRYLFQTSKIPKLRVIDSDYINNVKKVYFQLKNLTVNEDYILEAIKKLMDLSRLDDFTSFKDLGYFAIIESLITHNPLDSGDSIGRQLKSKIKLLNNQFENKLNFQYYFGDTSIDKCINSLYAYRSSIAHGSVFSFTGKDQVLKNKENVRSFLDDLVKSIILYACENPMLVFDLKKC